MTFGKKIVKKILGKGLDIEDDIFSENLELYKCRFCGEVFNDYRTYEFHMRHKETSYPDSR